MKSDPSEPNDEVGWGRRRVEEKKRGETNRRLQLQIQ
jgi:hypothetical protein